MKTINTKPQSLKTALLTTSIVALFTAGSAAYAGNEEDKAKRMYVDPVTGETKEATKLLSEMTDTEKALLSNEEYRVLKELEMKLQEGQQQEAADE